MDIGFHSLSASYLAYRLGERKKNRLWLAALIGILPDVVALTGIAFGWRYAYRWSHSLTLNIPFTFLLYRYYPRLAWGLLLHVGCDVISHRYATRYLFFPWRFPQLPLGINWHSWPGSLMWLGLWMGLVWLIYTEYRHAKSRLYDPERLFESSHGANRNP